LKIKIWDSQYEINTSPNGDFLKKCVKEGHLTNVARRDWELSQSCISISYKRRLRKEIFLRVKFPFFGLGINLTRLIL